MNQAMVLEWAQRFVFALLGVVHLMPLAGLLGRAALERGYGIRLADPQLVLLMQHRALLFGLIAAGCFAAALNQSLRGPMTLAALVSMLGFVLIAAMYPHGSAIARVFWVDLIGSGLLLAVWLWKRLIQTN